MQDGMNAFVYVVESTKPNDLLVGRCEGRALGESLSLAQIPNSYSFAADRATFEECFGDRLWRTARSQGDRGPIVHLSVHGNEHGIGLTDGSLIPWTDLRAMLEPISKVLNGYLLVCLSSCWGAAGCKMAMELGDKPFSILVGPTASVPWNDAAVAYITFYHRLFKGYDVVESVRAMCVASANDSFMPFSGELIAKEWKKNKSG